MAVRSRLWGVLLIVTIGAADPASATAQLPDPIAFVTVVTGGGVARISRGATVTLDGKSFSPRDNAVRLGDSVVTALDGSAAVVMPELGAMAYLEPATRLQFEGGPRSFGGDAFVIRLLEGRASISQKSAKPKFVVAGGTDATAGLVVIREGTVIVTADEKAVTFAVTYGAATFVSGPIPDVLPVELSGAVQLRQGQSISTTAPQTPVAYDRDAAAAVSKQMTEDVYAFGVEQSTAWVKRAERGDFTPVPVGGERGGELLPSDMAPTTAFDQPQQLTAVTAPRGAPSTAVRTIVSPAQSLLESGIPGSVIAGQRFRRSRIIGSPGTGGLIVNPNVEQLIRIAGQ